VLKTPNTSMALRSRRSIVLAIAVVVSCLGLGWMRANDLLADGRSLPSDGEVTAVWTQHASTLSDLVTLSGTDADFDRITASSASRWDQGLTPSERRADLPEERLREYSQRFDQVGLAHGLYRNSYQDGQVAVLFPIATSGVVLADTEKGIAFRNFAPRREFASLDDRSQLLPKSKAPVYRSIGNGWFIYFYEY
jgi:hypothetical protein